MGEDTHIAMARTKVNSKTKNQVRAGLVSMDQSVTATKSKEIRNKITNNCMSKLSLKILAHESLYQVVPTAMGVYIAPL